MFHSYLMQILILLTISNLMANNTERIPVTNLPFEETIIADSIIIYVYNALEGIDAKTKIEGYIYNLGNQIHIKTKKQTVMKHLLFTKGEHVSTNTLIESERNLRKQLFIADAKIEIIKKSYDSTFIYVTIFDQWTTILESAVKRFGNQWIYRIGIGESNILGTGQAISMSHYANLHSEGNSFTYYNSVLSKYRLPFLVQFTDSDNGFNFKYSIENPIRSKNDQYSFLMHYQISKSSQWYYYDGNQLNVEDLQEVVFSETNEIAEFTDILSRNIYFDFTRSYGFTNKIDLGIIHHRYFKKHASTQ